MLRTCFRLVRAWRLPLQVLWHWWWSLKHWTNWDQIFSLRGFSSFFLMEYAFNGNPGYWGYISMFRNRSIILAPIGSCTICNLDSFPDRWILPHRHRLIWLIYPTLNFLWSSVNWVRCWMMLSTFMPIRPRTHLPNKRLVLAVSRWLFACSQLCWVSTESDVLGLLLPCRW